MRYKIDKVIAGAKALHKRLNSAANVLSDGLYTVYHDYLCSDGADVEICKIIETNFKRPFTPNTLSSIPYPSPDASEIEHLDFESNQTGLATCDVGYIDSDGRVFYHNVDLLIDGLLYPKVNGYGFVYWVLLHNGKELRIYESLGMVEYMLKVCENLESIELTDAEAEVILGVKPQNRFVTYAGKECEYANNS